MKSESTDGQPRPFRHPFLQTCGMFVGEMLCLLPFLALKFWSRGAQNQPTTNGCCNHSWVFMVPAILDLISTSLQYIGLSLTYASSFQMLRGSVIIFTGILSKLILRTQIGLHKWLGILFVTLGLVTVGISDFDSVPKTTNNFQWVGDLMIIIAQIIVALQMVYEEKYLAQYQLSPLQTVGIEGIFGFTLTAILFVPFYYLKVGPIFGPNPRMVLEDVYDGLYQLAHNGWLAAAFGSTVVSNLK